MKGFAKNIMVAVKGACMGAADVIPGVSGGTIAFIMGIYDEFVGSLASVNGEAVRLLLKGQFKAFWKHINGSFLLSLVIGIGISVVVLAGLMQHLLEWYPIQTWAFFFGLIVASSIFILRGISGWGWREVLTLIFGILLGAVVCTLSPTQTPDALWFIFLSGAIAICAMILPGISGSFILLILGKYQFIMGVISDLVSGVNFGQNLLILSTFGVGAIVGILSFSKFLHWLLARWQKPTMLVLAGFIIGSLVKVWPWSNKDAIVCSQFAGASTLEETMSAVQGSGLGPDAAQEIFDTTIARYVDHIDPMIGSAVIFALIGFFLVTGIEIAGKVIAKRKAA
jgi:putative membrane protein